MFSMHGFCAHSRGLLEDRHVSGGQKKCTTLGLVSLSHLYVYIYIYCIYMYIYMGFIDPKYDNCQILNPEKHPQQ